MTTFPFFLRPCIKVTFHDRLAPLIQPLGWRFISFAGADLHQRLGRGDVTWPLRNGTYLEIAFPLIAHEDAKNGYQICKIRISCRSILN